jgi:hypothetical protein
MDDLVEFAIQEGGNDSDLVGHEVEEVNDGEEDTDAIPVSDR